MDSRRPTDTLAKLDGLHVLVVDDDPDARDLLATVLETRSAHVQCAGSASEAMACMREHKPDVLVSDIGMPGEDGYSLIQRVRSLGEAEGGTVPAIALTAFNQERDRQQALSSGFSEHLSKPVDLPLLCLELQRLGMTKVGGRQPLEQLRETTRALHDQLEEQLYARRVLEGRVSRAEYAAFLQAMYLLHRELESAIAHADEPWLRELLSDDMHKVPLLAEDLRELNVPPLPEGAVASHAEALAASFHAASVRDPFFLAGALYVLEGSTLGGRVQRSALLRRSDFQSLGHKYLSGYPNGTREHFEHFARRLNNGLMGRDVELARASAGAVATFEAMARILDAITRDDSVRIATALHGLPLAEPLADR